MENPEVNIVDVIFCAFLSFLMGIAVTMFAYEKSSTDQKKNIDAPEKCCIVNKN